ncbi:metal ABC transporter permease [Kocuria carniphila]|uniref:Metal ABC transporter permease n=1 Tax=Kocuria carniphila TaxID=262208 RepID=A0ABV3V1I9_9MICC|nr:metal ABC transporter permease [Kocuria carniphila]PZP24584.1 MAG: ABC transporter permease [Kocuria rhizophila]
MIPTQVDWDSIVDSVFVFDNYGELLVLLSNSLWAGALLGLVGGLVGTFVMMRDLAFSVHGIAELSFAGAAAALLIGSDIVTGSLLGSVLAALIIGFMGLRARDSNSFVGVLMPFGLGLGILFLSLYEGRSSNKFSLLTGQIVSVSPVQLTSMIVLSIVVVAGLLIVWRPLTFASTDPVVAEARGLPVRTLSIVFMVLLGISVAMSVQIVGALLVLALLITPAAAAMNLTVAPARIVVLSVVFAELSMVGGILLALGGSIPISPYVTTISFAIWLVTRVIRGIRERGSSYRRGGSEKDPHGRGQDAHLHGQGPQGLPVPVSNVRG